ncbi:cupin domain-containing protein [Pseudoclavibacter sp. CFCC 11306]|uniref:cupin domain-containing protein n=1 Tax=Pseudoclavibacter sp. CFCC 11306 TaxID=1564493 RepID=UPI001300E23B|nr:cupin domain-containing protein [Pseudoclavibacter sp. CFCC 11306]KAB1659201.1 cupin domain-containing protein [Pseudoclavibacter sp. CFCC 11306]
MSGTEGALPVGSAVDVGAQPILHSSVPEAQVVSGTPTTGVRPVGELGDLRVGIWEMSEGCMSDVEQDEFFVVISGAAQVEFLEPHGNAVELRPGSLMRLGAGMRTRWTVTQGPLRKVYLTRS